MEHIQRLCTIGLLMATASLASCTATSPTPTATLSTATDSIVGTYACTGPRPGTQRPDETWELREDGTVKQTAQDGAVLMEGTWVLDGNAVTFTFEGPPEEFRVVDGRLEVGPPGDPAWVCTPA